jgi:hypothetical protein
MPRGTFPGGRDEFPCRTSAIEQCPCLRQQDLTYRRQPRPAGPSGTLEEQCAEVAFELANRFAHCGLYDQQARRSRAERALIDDGNEVLQLAQIHNYIIPSRDGEYQ